MINVIHSKVFRRMLISFFLVVLIVFAFFAVISQNTIRALEKNAHISNDLQLHLCCNKIDSIVRFCDEIAIQTANSNSLKKVLLIDSVDNGQAAYDIMRAVQEISSVTNLLSSVAKPYESFYIYFPHSDLVLTASTAYLDSKSFYKQYFCKNPMEMTLEEEEMYQRWRSLLSEKQKNMMTLSEDWSSVGKNIEIIRTAPFDYIKGTKYCTICVLISEKKTLDIIESTVEIPGVRFSIHNSKTGYITGNIKEEEDEKLLECLRRQEEGYSNKIVFDNVEMLTSRLYSNDTGIEYNIATPIDYIKKTILEQYEVIFRWMLALLFLCLIVACLLSYANFKPIRKIVNGLTGDLFAQKGKDDEYKMIEKGILNLKNDNLRYQKLLIEAEKRFKEIVLQKLCNGEYHDVHEIQTAFSEASLQFPEFGAIALCIRLNMSTQETPMENYMCDQQFSILLQQLLPENVYSRPAAEGIWAILFPSAGNDRDMEADALKMSEEIINKLPSPLCGEIMISIGAPCTVITDFYRSFNDALRAMNSKSPNEQGIVHYNLLQGQSIDTLNYPLETEIHLIQMVKDGKKNEVQAILRNLYEENITRKNLRSEGKKQFLFALCSTYDRIVFDLQIAARPIERLVFKDKNVYNADEMNSIFKTICENYLLLTESVEKAEKMIEGSQDGRIQNYILEHYRDSAFSLTELSQHVRLSETYLSTYFKNRFRVNFSTYLEHLRIQKALFMLKDTETQISEIAVAVGYNSDQSFRRAFKRVVGKTPSEMRM